jgi:2-alkyl-3-oxoalkanoate reductase
MKVFLTGGTGAIGKALLPLLLKHGHTVTALVRNNDKGRAVAAAGAKAVVADPLSREDLIDVVVDARPEIIIHQLTALTGAGNFKKFDREFALTNRFRTEVTDTLIAAARKAGTQRLIAQSFCGWPFARDGGPVKTEDDPLDPNPAPSFIRTLHAIQHLEKAISNATDLQAIALRYGLFYGPNTSVMRGTPTVEMVRKRRFPIVGSGAGVWSFIHVDDAATATVAAVTNGAPGIYNIVDDEPAPVSQWLPYLSAVLGCKPPLRVPVWLGRLFIGDAGVAMMTNVRGGSNAKAKRELQWQPKYASWRHGFVDLFAPGAVEASNSNKV